MRRSSLMNQDRTKSISKHSRRTAASMAQLLDSKKPKLGKVLLSSFRNLLSPHRKQIDTEVARNENKRAVYCKEKKLVKQSEVEELKRTVKEKEKESKKLDEQINRFEKMFELLCKSLEDGDGIEEFLRISFFVQNKFQHLKLKHLNSLRNSNSNNLGLKEQLDSVKRRIKNLLAYSKLKL